jgi:uncharacterized protein YhbP (UPF0306 family)
VFYVFIEEEATLVFASDQVTRHIAEALHNQNVAGTIVLETELIGLIRGVQFTGIFVQPEPELRKKVLRAYLKRFPYAVLKGAPAWMAGLYKIDLYEIKFTDNRLGFGKKILWSRD